MGGSVSYLPSHGANIPYFSITIRRPNKLKLIGASEQAISFVRDGIRNSWHLGIQNEKEPISRVFIFKLSGRPFETTSTSHDAAKARRMLCQILSTLMLNGYKLILTADLTRYDDYSTWFFKNNGTAQNLLLPKVVGIGISSWDKISIVNGDDTILWQVKDAIHPDIQNINTDFANEGFYSIKINGFPWDNRSFDTGINARYILLKLFKNMANIGFRFYGTANPKGKADTMFFIKDDTQDNFQHCQYAMLSLNKNDRLRLIDLPIEMRPIIRQCLTANSYRGIQEEIPHDTRVHEFKLNGHPWLSSGEEAMHARLVLSRILDITLQYGWCVATGLDISRNANDKGVIVLRSCQPARLSHFVLAPTSTDKLKIIDAPKDIINIFQNVVANIWSPGIVQTKAYENGLSVKLHGSPWAASSGYDWALARLMIVQFIAKVYNNGWDCICSADVSARYAHRENAPDYPIDVHSMFFVKTNRNAQDNIASTSAIPSAPQMYEFDHDALPSYEEAIKY